MTHVFSGSDMHRALLMLEASGPMTTADLRSAVEIPAHRHIPTLMQAMLREHCVRVVDTRWVFVKMPRVVDRRARVQRVAMREVPLPTPVIIGTLRTMMDTGATIATGDPLRALADALDAARTLLASPRGRFRGAEVELLVAREIRSVTVAAQLATATLQQALEVLAP